MQDETSQIEQAILTIIKYIGDDPTREGLSKTPARVASSLKELFSGYSFNLDDIFTSMQTSENSQMIVSRNHLFRSFCEHHMQPFNGFIDIAYIPDKYIVGIGNFEKLISAYSRRLQIQERLTEQIANFIFNKLKPLAVAVKINAKHGCLGAQCYNHSLQTYKFLGIFEEKPHLVTEFLK